MTDKIKIVSDGTPRGTQVINEVTGERLKNVTAIEWRIECTNIAEATVTFRNVPVEFIIDSKCLNKERIHKRRINLES
jgi:hypothetical protein